jgi:hypothetical protein
MSEKMTIAQALRRVKKLKGQIAENTQRCQLGVSYESTKVPNFRFQDSFEALTNAQLEMVKLESRIAVANATAYVPFKGENLLLARAVRMLQELKGQIAFLKGLHLRSETVKERNQEWDDVEMKHVHRVTEVQFVSDLSEKQRDSQVKEIQDTFEALNNAVEDMNHTVLV